MNKWEKIFLISLTILTVVIICLIYNMTRQAYSLINTSQNVSKAYAKLDSTEKEIDSLQAEYNKLSQEMQQIQRLDSLNENGDTVIQKVIKESTEKLK